jgi:hypothetical protein
VALAVGPDTGLPGSDSCQPPSEAGGQEGGKRVQEHRTLRESNHAIKDVFHFYSLLGISKIISKQTLKYFFK